MNKNKTLQRLLGAALSVTLLLGMAGCGSTNSEKSSESSKSEQKVESSVQESTASTETVVEEEGITYPLDTDVKLSIWTARVKPNDAYEDVSQSPFHSGLAKQTGVELEWQFPLKGTREGEGFTLLMAEDKLPDIIHVGWGSILDAQILLDEGIIYDLTEYLPKYAPDYWAFINQPQYQDVLKAATTESGKQFCVAAFVESDYNITYTGPIVRKDWLDECGLDEPVTLADWEEMLTKFKEKYDVTPLTRADGIGSMTSGTGVFGTRTATWYVDDNDKIQFAQLQPEYKEYIETMKRWWDNGLIDKDAFTIDTAGTRNKAANNLIGATVGPMSLLTSIVENAKGTDAEWIGVGYPRVAEGVPTSYIQSARNEWTANVGSVITKDCSEEELIIALQFLNYAYTEEGMMYWNFGEEGVSYTLNSQGEPEWTELVTNDPLGIDAAASKYSGAGSYPMGVQMETFVQMKNSKAAAAAVYKWIENSDAPASRVPTQLLYTDEENLIYTEKFAAIKTYVSETSLKFITGEISLDEYDAFIEQLNKLGLQECQKIQQAAYDRFMAK